MALTDLDKLAKDDRAAAEEALRTGDWSRVSTPALRVLADLPYSPGEAASTAFSRAATSTVRGIAQLFAGDEEDSLVSIADEDLEMEKKLRAVLELNPGTGWSSYIAGSVFDPINAIGVGAYKTAGQALVRLGALGGAAGFVEPTYDEYDDSRVFNAAVGAGAVGLFGAGLTGLANKIAGKSSKEVEQALTSQASDNLAAASTTGPTATTTVKPRIKVKPTVRESEQLGFDLNAGMTPEQTFGLPVPTPEQVFQFTPPKLPRELSRAAPRWGSKLTVFESDLDRAFYIIAKDKNKSAADDKYLKFVMDNTGLSESAARAEGRRLKKDISEIAKNSGDTVNIPTLWKPNIKIPRPTTPSVQQTAINAKQINEIPKLSTELNAESVVKNNSELVFESDIDKASVAFTSGSKNKDQYLDYIKNTFGINDQQAKNVITAISKEIDSKVKNRAITEGGLQDKTTLKMSDTLDNLMNPVYKHMDDESRFVYNYSKMMTAPDGKPRFRVDDGFRQFVTKMQEIFPGIQAKEAVSTAQGYQRMMDNLKAEKGSKFTSTNIRDFAKNRNANLDAFIASVKRGDLDGCWS